MILQSIRQMMTLVIAVYMAIGLSSSDVSNHVTAASLTWDRSSRISGGYKAPVQLKEGSILTCRSVELKPKGNAVLCFKSEDGGLTWSYLSEIVRDDAADTDIGDGHIMQLSSGEVLYSYRRNHCEGRSKDERDYHLEVAVSNDNGMTWKPHSQVASSCGAQVGLWSTFLLEKKDGALQCYYDDEDTPAKNGFRGHQWLTMKTWDPKSRRWVDPVTVSRAHNSKHLSREGMCGVVEVSPDKLICVFETVQTKHPNRGLIMMVTSDDGGKTWSWQEQERRTVYQPNDTTFNALAPWLIQLSNGDLFCVFTTDESRAKPTAPHTGILFQDVKYIVSHDSGTTWLGPYLIDSDYPCYYPGVCELTYGRHKGTLLVQYNQREFGYMNKHGRFGASH